MVLVNCYVLQVKKKTISRAFIPIPPQALGDDIDVPFINCVPLSVQLGTAAIAPPGALILTPNEPSVL